MPLSLGTCEPVSVSSLRQKLSVLKRRHADKLGKSYRARPKVRCKSLPAREACEDSQASEFMRETGGSNSPEVTLKAVSLGPLVLGSGTRAVGPAAASPVRVQTDGCESRLLRSSSPSCRRSCLMCAAFVLCHLDVLQEGLESLASSNMLSARLSCVLLSPILVSRRVSGICSLTNWPSSHEPGPAQLSTNF